MTLLDQIEQYLEDEGIGTIGTDIFDGEIPLDKLTFDENGQIIIPAKTVTALDPDTGMPVTLPIQLIPSSYAGKRDVVSRDEHGKLLLVGLPVEDDFNLADKLMQIRQQKMIPLNGIRSWHMQEAKAPDGVKKPNREP